MRRLTHIWLIPPNRCLYSHTSCEVRQYNTSILSGQKNVSTHTPHARCDTTKAVIHAVTAVSTHTPHARCDWPSVAGKWTSESFYSHTSCEVRHACNWISEENRIENNHAEPILTTGLVLFLGKNISRTNRQMIEIQVCRCQLWIATHRRTFICQKK